MKIITGINKWKVGDENGNMSDETFGQQIDAEAFGGKQVVQGKCKEATIYAAVSKMILPPVEAIRVDV